VLDRPASGRIFFDQVIADNLDIGRPDRVGLIFGRRIIRNPVLIPRHLGHRPAINQGQPTMVATMLGMANPGNATVNVVGPMRRLGLIDLDGSLTTRGNKRRVDASHGEA